MKYKNCAWCGSIMQDRSTIINVTIKSREDISYESGQYIEKIILIFSKEKTPCFPHFEDHENETRYKEIPVFIIPYRDDEKNIAINTCSYECAGAVKAALQSEEYVFEWNFS